MAPPNVLGELDLKILLSSLTTTLHPDTFVFIAMPDSVTSIGELPPSLNAQMAFQEPEGLTIITTEADATSHGLQFTFRCRMITLNVHSSLEAVGFIARIAAKLTELGIGVNPISGFYHDHLFVPVGREQEVITALEDLVKDSTQE